MGEWMDHHQDQTVFGGEQAAEARDHHHPDGFEHGHVPHPAFMLTVAHNGEGDVMGVGIINNVGELRQSSCCVMHTLAGLCNTVAATFGPTGVSDLVEAIVEFRDQDVRDAEVVPHNNN